MALEVDLVVSGVEEVVEAHLVQPGGRGVGRHVAAEPQPARPGYHRRGVPSVVRRDAFLQLQVARVLRLLRGRHGIDIAGGRGETPQQVVGPFGAGCAADRLKGFEPFGGLLRIQVCIHVTIKHRIIG
nr:hypothetical protein [Microbispora rosea]